MKLRRLLILAATGLAFGVVALGAYVRLSDAGLGCPDWPGCYGHLAVPDHAADTGKAWKEMVHRYFAATLGLMIFALAAISWRGAVRRERAPALPTALVGIVVCQALLGMWTVTLLLKPLVVTAHLLGGMTTLALLVSLSLEEGRAPPAADLRLPAGLALAAVIGQIALGGWVSSNYAALACPDFPTCQGQWLPEADFGHGFTLHRELGQTADGALLPLEALAAIHWTHRLGALVAALLVANLALRLLAFSAWKVLGKLLLGLLGLQIGLGIANVLLALPLPVAVAHNLGAAALLTATLAANLRLWQGRGESVRQPRQQLAVDAPEAAVAHDQNVIA